MNVRFDSVAANMLLNSMMRYCSNIQRDALELMRLTSFIKGWNDQQFERLQSDLQIMCVDLDKILRIQGDYMNHFKTRIEELRE